MLPWIRMLLTTSRPADCGIVSYLHRRCLKAGAHWALLISSAVLHCLVSRDNLSIISIKSRYIECSVPVSENIVHPSSVRTRKSRGNHLSGPSRHRADLLLVGSSAVAQGFADPWLPRRELRVRKFNPDSATALQTKVLYMEDVFCFSVWC